ncbi:MAG: hypothetical protein KatS3mg031_0449 [Chitinophagales bacterium]|nr:MAG: hypothetical protein KatS3mg031_0449 [Chitinophagales bacterium]
MKRQINWSKIRESHAVGSFLIDLTMIILVILNLLFIVFDWHFQFGFFKNLIAALSPAFYQFYSQQVHPNFLLYDGIFVAIFLTELFIRWALAVKRKTYDKWFFYPFVRWYDVLGCIPLGTFRWLRILRIVSMMIRLHKMGVINLTNTFIYRELQKIIQILTEEISDRVVIHVLNGVQREIKQDNPIVTRMITEVIRPHQDVLTLWIAHRVKKATEQNYALYHEDIRNYIRSLVEKAVENNQEVKNIAAIPVIGRQIRQALKTSVSDITFTVIHGMVQDLSGNHNNKFIDEATSIIFDTVLVKEEDPELNRVAKDIFLRAIELVKEQIALKLWKLEERAS